MKNNHKTIWKCFYTDQPTTVLHEVFFGNGVREEYGIKYNIQVPVIDTVHDCCHGKLYFSVGYKEFWQKKACEWLGVDFDNVNLAINTKNKVFLKKISEICLKKLKESEV